MRSAFRRPFTLGVILATALAWSGCDAKKQTEYVAGISTQVVVPRDMKAIVVNVSVGGVPQFCRAYRVYDGRVQLPRSLGEFPTGGKPGPDPITVTVVGFTDELSETSSNPVFADCVFNAAKVGENGARVLRRSRQPYVEDEILFLPMPLKFSCFDKDCSTEPNGDQKTCKAGRCEDATVDERLLPKFSADLVDGTGGACFPAKECFAGAVPAVVVDPNDCTYALPNTPSAPPVVMGAPPSPLTPCPPGVPCDGINVEVTYDGGYNREIIDKDPVEGFFVPDAAKPQRFRLGQGMCDMVKGVGPDGKPTPHRITAIRATGLCRSKGPFQPLCADDQLEAMSTPGGVSSAPASTAVCKPIELKPAPSVLMILADDTENHAIFYTGGGGAGVGSGEAAQSSLVSEALQDPSFSNTVIGLTLFPGGAGAACSPHPVDVAPALKETSQPAIVKKFSSLKVEGSLKAKDTDLKMSGALDDAYNLLKTGFPKAHRRAVLVIGNRGFDTNTCGGVGTPTARAAAARATATEKIDTYVAIFARDRFIVPEPSIPPVVPGAQTVAEAGAPPASGAHPFDARADKGQATDALRKIVDDLATCAYESKDDPGPTAVITYSDPVAVPGLQKAFYTIPHDAACSGDGATGNGWGYNATAQRIYVCGKACQDYRDTLRQAAGFGAQYGQRALAVPLFSHKAECAPK